MAFPVAIHRAKLRRPRLHERLVIRSRLHSRLDRALQTPLTVVIAPAGFGKSTLATTWLDAGSTPAAWVTLDAADVQIERFVAHLVAAIEPFAPAIRGALDDLPATHAAPPSEIGATLADALLDLADDTVVLLDDCDRAMSPTVADLLATFIAHLPPPAHLMLLSRIDPPLALARFRAQGQVNELRGADLRFTDEETRRLLTMSDAAVDDATVAALHRQTGGWPAALALAAQTSPSRHSAAKIIAVAESRSHLMEFLVEEVLAQQTGPTQDLLLAAATADEFTAALADALLAGAAPANGSLENILALIQVDLFLERVDDRPDWFRFQPVFRDLLRQQLALRRSPAAIAELHRRAGAWFADQDMIGEAIAHLLAAADPAAAADLVEQRLQAVLAREAWATLADWLGRLPDAVVRARPALLVGRAWVAHLSGRAAPLHAHLAEASRHLAEIAADDPIAAWRGDIATLAFTTLLPIEQDPAAARRLAERAASLTPAEHRFAAGLAHGFVSMSMLALGQRDEAIRRETAHAAREAERIDAGSMRALLCLMFMHRQAGQFEPLADVARQALTLCERDDLPVTAGWARLFLGWVAYERDDIDDAIAWFERVIADARRMHLSGVREAMFGLALAVQSQGRPRDADDLLRRLVEIIIDAQALEQLPVVHGFEARLALLRRQPDPAIRWLSSADVSVDSNTLHAFEHALLTGVRTLIAIGSTGSLARAEADIAAIRARAESAHFEARLVEIWALAALTYEAQQRSADADAAMTRSLASAPDADFIRTYLDLGPAVFPILRRLDAGGLQNRRLAQLLRRADADEGTPTPALRPHSVHLLLTTRELEVLERLAQRLSYKEIGEQLFISPMTVKRHTGSIYNKLDVGSRREALAKAHDLGWRAKP